MLSNSSQKIPAVEYIAVPDDGKRYQLIDGQLVAIEPSVEHQEILGYLSTELGSIVRAKQHGKVFMLVGTFIGEYDVYQPDILFVRRENLSIIEMDGVHGAPDFVIEILSPSNAYYDLKHKKDIYEEIGVREYWIVGPKDHTIECFLNSEKGFETVFLGKGIGRACSKAVPEFCVEVSDVFSL